MQTALSAVHLEYITKFVAMREKSPKMARFWLQAASRHILSDSRLRVCYRYRVPEKTTVDLKYSPERKSAYYCNLMKCGLGWVCPLCATRLSEERRSMLSLALSNARTIYLPVMVTYTIRHHKGERLADNLNGMTSAYRTMRQQRSWRVIKEEFLIEGEIRSTEITYGDDGWHPHFHVILFMSLDILKYAIRTHQNGLEGASEVYDVLELRDALQNHLARLWLEALAKVGLSAMAGPALKVTADYDQLSDYMTKFGTELPESGKKWTLAHEATKGGAKAARADGNVSVWELLMLAGIDVPGFTKLWVEYSLATKGKSSLQWTPGLQARLGVKDSEGNILLDEFTNDEILLAQFDVTTWDKILRHDAAGRVLDLASTGDDEKVWHFIDGLKEREETVSLNVDPY